MGLLSKRKTLLAKVEAVYGVAETPTGVDDAICVNDQTLKRVAVLAPANDEQKAEFGEDAAEYVGGLMEYGCTAKCKGSGTLGVAPELHPLLRCCGLEQIVTAGVSVGYNTNSAIGDATTLVIYRDGKKTVLAGCRGEASLSVGVGGHLVWTFVIQGHEISRTTEQAPAATFDTTRAIAFIREPVTRGADTLKIQNFSFALGNEIPQEPVSGEDDGYGEVLITDRLVTGSVDPEEVLDTERDDDTIWKDGSTADINILNLGKSAGNLVSFTFRETFYKEVAEGDRSGVMINEIGFGCASGDGALSVVFT